MVPSDAVHVNYTSEFDSLAMPACGFMKTYLCSGKRACAYSPENESLIILRTCSTFWLVSLKPGVSINVTVRPSRENVDDSNSVVQLPSDLLTGRFDPLAILIN